jgi:hypothetical protein
MKANMGMFGYKRCGISDADIRGNIKYVVEVILSYNESMKLYRWKFWEGMIG